jgi:methyl-accepting chemotaxis protein
MRLKIGARVRLYFAAVIAIVLALGAVGYGAMVRIARELGGSINDAFQTSADLSDLRLLAREARLVLAKSAAAATTSDLPLVDGLTNRFNQQLAQLTPRLPPSVHADEIARLMDAAVTSGREYAKANAQQQWNRAGELGPEFSRAAAAIESNLEAAQGAERAWVANRLADASAEVRNRALTFGAGIAACLLLALLFTWSLQRSLVDPLGTLKEATARIVEHGDLAQTISVRSGDEIGELGASFARLVEKLREIPSMLQDSAQVLARSVGDLGVTATEQRESILRQAAAVDETHVTANEIRQTSAVAAQKAEHVLKVVAQADEVSRAGEESVERSLKGLSEIGESVASTAQKIELLKERMRQIDGINLTVKDLADQSNMLALNAAIEAVRSGEHGKGFAVVAREIRNLADQSIQSTGRVREILTDISRSIEEAVNISGESRRRAENGLAEIRSSGETLRALSAMVKDTSDAIRQITASVSQQNAGISQIFTAVSDLGEGMRDTRSRLDSTSEAIDRLKMVTDRVSQIVSSYRT